MEEEKIRNFKEDLENSQNVSLQESWLEVLHDIFGEGKVEWKNSKEVQVGMGTDLVYVTKKGRRYSIELKGRRSTYLDNNCYVFEIKQHRYTDVNCTKLYDSVPGWLYKSTAEYLIWGTIVDNNIKEVLGFSLSPFKDAAFKNKITNLKECFAPHTYFPDSKVYGKTLLKKVDKGFIMEHAKWSYYKRYN